MPSPPPVDQSNNSSQKTQKQISIPPRPPKLAPDRRSPTHAHRQIRQSPKDLIMITLTPGKRRSTHRCSCPATSRTELRIAESFDPNKLELCLKTEMQIWFHQGNKTKHDLHNQNNTPPYILKIAIALFTAIHIEYTAIIFWAHFQSNPLRFFRGYK